MQCHLRRLDENRMLCLQLDPSLPVITIYLIDQLNDIILSSKISQNQHTIPLIKLFSDVRSFYHYLSGQDSEVEVTEKDRKLFLKYEVFNLLKQSTINKISLQTRTYLPNYRILSHKQQPESSSLRKERSLLKEKQVIQDGEYRFQDYFENQSEEIKNLKGHSGWFVNLRQKMLLQVGTLSFASQENDWQTITHRMNINLNKHHLSEEETPRYDVTLGLASRHLLPKMRQSFNDTLGETISLTMMGRKITSQCFTLREQLQFRNVLSPQSLQLCVTCRRKSDSMRILRVQFLLNQHKQINFFGEDRMQQFLQKLEHLQEMVVFLYLHRSFLHFSFNTSILPAQKD